MQFAPVPIESAATANPFLHIPDGFLSIAIALFCWILAIVSLAIAVRHAQRDFDERLAPLAGVMAAFIFAGQLINFPVAGGTSGHLIGATLVFVVLGPWLGLLAMTAVIILQALLFQDGGLIVMGANILVMGIIPGMVGYGFFQLAQHKSGWVKTAVIGTGAWLSVIAAALITTLLLGFSGTTSLDIAIPFMLGIHALIGIGEALITIAAFNFIIRTRPALLSQDNGTSGTGWIVGGTVIALLIAFISPLASALPDGLEWVAAEAGFIDAAQDAPISILPNYTLPFVGETAVSTILAGIFGVLLVGGIMFIVLRMIKRPSPQQEILKR
jgi:cobalt/nickel transport system permease protein